MTILAIRPDSWNLPLLLHVGGAMITTGAVAVAFAALLMAWRQAEGDGALVRFAFRTLLYVAVPSYIVMRGSAQWVLSKEGLDNLPSDPSWIGIGFTVGDGGTVVLIITTILVGLAARRSRTSPGVMARIGTVLGAIMLVAFLVAVWAMTAKPA
jgi:hypothetical protein